MKSKNSLALVVALSALAGSAAAQTDSLSAALDAARGAVAASPAKPASCADAKELETRFEFTVTFANSAKPLEQVFEYAGCEEEGRNDYLPPYTTRSYKGADGYGLTIVTDEGASASDVLVSKGKDFVGRFGLRDNAALVSGNPVSASAMGGKAVLRDAVKPMYPQLKACEAADWSKAAVGVPGRSGGKPDMGFTRGGPSLVLLSKTSAYYYHEDCDICAELTKCELATGKLTSTIAAHSVDCADLTAYRSEPGVIYDACAESR